MERCGVPRRVCLSAGTSRPAWRVDPDGAGTGVQGEDREGALGLQAVARWWYASHSPALVEDVLRGPAPCPGVADQRSIFCAISFSTAWPGATSIWKCPCLGDLARLQSVDLLVETPGHIEQHGGYVTVEAGRRRSAALDPVRRGREEPPEARLLGDRFGE